jgi:hypothetical protein
MDIKPIETRYKGYRFRSRLEARWAVFFDAIGIEWEYEKEGFTNDEGDYYLPDFYLPETKTWVEVKGDTNYFLEDKNHEKMVRLLDYGGVLPHFSWSGGKEHSTRGLLLLGNIPEPKFDGQYIFPIIQHDKGLERQWVRFQVWVDKKSGCVKGSIDNVSKNNLVHENYLFFLIIPNEVMFSVMPDHCLESVKRFWKIENNFINCDHSYQHYDIIVHALEKARSARFEHGE